MRCSLLVLVSLSITRSRWLGLDWWWWYWYVSAVKAARLEAANEGGRSRRSKSSASSSSWLPSSVELPPKPRRQLTAEELEQRRARVRISIVPWPHVSHFIGNTSTICTILYVWFVTLKLSSFYTMITFCFITRFGVMFDLLPGIMVRAVLETFIQC